MKGGDSEERRGWMRPALQQKKGQLSFSARPPPFLFSYLPPQKCVALSNQMYIDIPISDEIGMFC
ncbi:hypothetical protein HMPREF0083_02670 [Aneurinibacillus aneurinilyticus ATCC 12856]|uniref:Uncharacterized protein n=1 Tax=Aneurinibacillus aneurinilyticus ATCC 12856 TaxID=649747 RepID=U1X2F4_ANEAE|nr:hypothetical protein HMPREF0083_02670 [Aneurinibacillus aneurinilyticus ATCC 12856]